MKLSTSKLLFIASAGICCLSAGILFAESETKLALGDEFAVKGIQHITEYVMFAIPSGGGWNDKGQVKVSADEARLKIEGSLVSNTSGGNAGGKISTSSLLGGTKNTLGEGVAESSILGGEGNKNLASRAFIAGGKNNTSAGESSVIL